MTPDHGHSWDMLSDYALNWVGTNLPQIVTKILALLPKFKYDRGGTLSGRGLSCLCMTEGASGQLLNGPPSIAEN